MVEPKPLSQSPIASIALNQPPRQRTIVDSTQERQSRGVEKDMHVATLSFNERPRDGKDTSLGDQCMTPSPHMGLMDEMSSLLAKLDYFARPRRHSTATVAKDEALFLQYDPRYDVASKDVLALGKILDLSAALLNRLQCRSRHVVTCPTKHTDTYVKRNYAGLDCPKTVANLEHVLRCLQHVAFEALAHCYSKIVEAEFAHWHSYWQQWWQTGDAWFTEWPSGRRPLNTTWPWDVKVSLLVLWGVCWMFYGNGGLPRNPQAAGFPSGNFRTGQTPHFNFASTNSNNEVWPTNSASDLQYPVESQSRLQASSRHANRAAISDYYTLPAFSTPVSSTYISTSSATSSDPFATPTQFWPYNRGIHPASGHSHQPGYHFDPNTRLLTERTSDLPSTQNLEADAPINLYAAQYNQASTNDLGGNIGKTGPSLGQPLNNMPGYPSPHSDMSDHRVSPCPSLFPATSMAPATVPRTMASKASSTYGSPLSAKSDEPVRNDEGVMYCSHENCAVLPEGPPTFARKCEWSKHMDKHTRPYVCEERGCEKIQGFTYSGGLLRHQREVHRQHGGPKASCMCPHSDCKRSIGAGFSRRENLIEHLRRVHRGVGDVGTETVPEGGRRTRKRRRAPVEEEQEAPGESPEEVKRRKATEDDDAPKATPSPELEPKDLRARVKQLELELQQKDERLRKLEETVARLAGGE